MRGATRAIATGILLGCHSNAAEPWPAPEECLTPAAPADRRACLQPHLQALAEQTSARYAVCEAARLQAEAVIDDCHLLAHAIGETNLELHAGDAAQALATCGTACIEGCLHGVMQRFIGTLPREVDTIGDAVYPLCSDVAERDHYACVHGVGHGLRHHGFLAFADAVHVCLRAPDHDWSEICVGGVFMEQVDLFLPLSLEGLGSVLPEICAELEGDALWEHCIAAIGEGLMFRTSHDLARTEELCLRLADGEAIEQCIHGARTEAELASVADRHGCD